MMRHAKLAVDKKVEVTKKCDCYCLEEYNFVRGVYASYVVGWTSMHASESFTFLRCLHFMCSWQLKEFVTFDNCFVACLSPNWEESYPVIMNEIPLSVIYNLQLPQTRSHS